MKGKKQVNPNFWRGKKVFITGHTGFKGTWLSLWLNAMGAHVTGYSLEPPTKPGLFHLCRMDELITSYIADIRDRERLSKALRQTAPDIVFHMAAQPLVRASYANPVETYEINSLGTVNLLEAVRQATESGIPVKAVVNVTTDKCYDNRKLKRGYRETDQLGGDDPYSNSKACAELMIAAYRKSFFSPNPKAALPNHQVSIASVRAGNVIGGGDWAQDRLIPDSMSALLQGKSIGLRYPQAIRPWMHVLEPLAGYLLLAEQLAENGVSYAKSWNFGPDARNPVSVEEVVSKLCNLWGAQSSYHIESGNQPFEAHYLQLDSTMAAKHLGWYPRWDLNTALARTVDWVKDYVQQKDVRETCLQQISDYVKEGEVHDH